MVCSDCGYPNSPHNFMEKSLCDYCMDEVCSKVEKIRSMFAEPFV
jgi:hypothetical protein